MKSILIGSILVLCSVTLHAQKFEHFNLQQSETYKSWRLYANFEEKFEGKTGIWYFGDYHAEVLNMLRKQILTLPKRIQQILRNSDVRINFLFDKDGTIFSVYFYGIQSLPTILSDSDWLALYRAILQIKLDVSKLEIPDREDFEVGEAVSFLIKKLLQTE